METKLKKQEAEIAGPAQGCRFYKTALIIEKQLDFEEWEGMFKNLHDWKGSALWWIGDALCYGEGKFNQQYAQVVDPTDYDIETIKVAHWVCRNVPFKNRHADIPFNTYKLIAKYNDAEQVKLIAKIREKHMSMRDVMRMLSVRKQKEKEAENAPPVLALGYVTEFGRNMRAVVHEMPISEWKKEPRDVLEAAFNAMVYDLRKEYGFNE